MRQKREEVAGWIIGIEVAGSGVIESFRKAVIFFKVHLSAAPSLRSRHALPRAGVQGRRAAEPAPVSARPGRGRCRK